MAKDTEATKDTSRGGQFILVLFVTAVCYFIGVRIYNNAQDKNVATEAARKELSSSGNPERDHSHNNQPPALPAPEKINLTSKWSKQVQTDGRPTGFSWTTGAQITVRLGMDGKYWERPIDKMGNDKADTLQFRLSQAFNGEARVTVHQFRNEADRDHWLKN